MKWHPTNNIATTTFDRLSAFRRALGAFFLLTKPEMTVADFFRPLYKEMIIITHFSFTFKGSPDPGSSKLKKFAANTDPGQSIGASIYELTSRPSTVPPVPKNYYPGF